MSAASACSNDTSEITGQLVKINSTVTQTGFSGGPVHIAKKERKAQTSYLYKRGKGIILIKRKRKRRERIRTEWQRGLLANRKKARYFNYLVLI